MISNEQRQRAEETAERLIRKQHDVHAGDRYDVSLGYRVTASHVVGDVTVVDRSKLFSVGVKPRARET